MKQYLELLKEVTLFPEETGRVNRTGIPTQSCFCRQIRLDLTEGFPLLTTKKIYTRSVVHELLWFLRGETDISYLQENNVHIWDAWAKEAGKVGPIYGYQWRKWSGYLDQLQAVIDSIKTDPFSRRHIVTAWNPADLPYMALPPCHCFFQFYVDKTETYLDCFMHMRSTDIFLGLPFDIASYAILQSMVAQLTNKIPRRLAINMVDLHLYENHREAAMLQLSRRPLPLPKLSLNAEIKNLNDFRFEDIQFTNYQSAAPIPAPIAI